MAEHVNAQLDTGAPHTQQTRARKSKPPLRRRAVMSGSFDGEIDAEIDRELLLNVLNGFKRGDFSVVRRFGGRAVRRESGVKARARRHKGWLSGAEFTRIYEIRCTGTGTPVRSKWTPR